MKTKIAFIGVGLRTLSFFKFLKLHPERCELVALCDLNSERMQYAAENHDLEGVRFFTDYRKCIAESGCDAVMIFTPDGEHEGPTVEALVSGKAVFLEKPLEITESACQRIMKADHEAGGRTYVGLNLRHVPFYRRIKELISAGIAGDLLTIQADEFYDGGRTYFRRWNRLQERSGGLWITKGCHDFDILQWIAGRRPVSVQAQSALTYYTPKEGAALYCSECSLEPECPDSFQRYSHGNETFRKFQTATMSEGGGRLDLCLYNSNKDTFDHGTATVRFEQDIFATYTLNVVSGFNNRRIRVSGTRATIDGDMDSQQIVIQHRDPSREEVIQCADTEGGHGGADKYLLPDFLDFVAGTSRNYVSPEEAFISIRMGLAARASCEKAGALQVL